MCRKLSLVEIKWTDIPLLKGLDLVEILQLISAGRLLKLHPGEYVFHAGDEGREMFVVVSGSVRVEAMVGGSRQVLARFKKGQIFGEIAFVTRTFRTADVIAEEPLETLEINEVFLRNLIEKMPQTAARILFNLSMVLSERLANTTRSLIDSEYENVLILFETLASETDITEAFNKFVSALEKALPRVGAVEFLMEDINFFWIRDGFEPYRPAFEVVEKHEGIFIDEEHYLTICPVRIEGQKTSHLVVSQSPGSPLSAKDLDMLMRVGTQLGLVIDHIRLYEEIKAMATTDPLTGLCNRNIFRKELGKEIMRSRRSGSPLSLLVADLDRFKSINDTFGHLAGDETLRKVALMITKAVRGIDSVCRYGGEEFVAILPSTDSSGAQLIAERIRQDVELLKVEFNGSEIHTTISIGVAVYGDESPEEFFEKADKACYLSKTRGRNRVSIAA
jgi:diguanylate cyclase (GGDEF)-like protein